MQHRVNRALEQMFLGRFLYLINFILGSLYTPCADAQVLNGLSLTAISLSVSLTGELHRRLYIYTRCSDLHAGVGDKVPRRTPHGSRKVKPAEWRILNAAFPCLMKRLGQEVEQCKQCSFGSRELNGLSMRRMQGCR